MKHATLTLVAIAFAILSNAQPKDTVQVPVYIYERTDTIQVETLVYKGDDGNMKWCSPGYYIMRSRLASKQGEQPKLLEQPLIIGGLDHTRKRQVKIIKNQ